MVNLFHRKPDVYIRQLQVCMCFSAINSPTPQQLVPGSSEDSGGVGDCGRPKTGRIQTLNTTFLPTSMPVFGYTFAVQIKCHSKTWDRFKERKYRGGHERLCVP